ncbi:saccharopine dehydrogenase family protein [Actinomadura scrupuli]|uniref:saccharopine dehydrogenase family protein n=1 Tax=Actinomadura scrupuli TaxID=559629 RepID=UPI003D97CAA5
MTADRTYDLVLFGATGFTGGLTAEYLAEHAPEGTRWALAGRNQAKLAALRERLTAFDPACKDLPLLHADVADSGSIRAVAESTRVVVTTVGPYITYGEPLVAACAAAGTDYLDLTGEPEFVDLMYVRHHEQARATGARIVHACGFDSIPHDLGAYFTVLQLPEDVPIRVEGFVRANGAASGGTAHSAITAMSRARQTARAALARRRVEPIPAGRRVRVVKGLSRFAPPSGAWTLPMPTIDPMVVTRSARALDRYGPDFSYGHYLAVRHLVGAAGAVAGVAGVFALAQLPPTRDLLLRIKSPGEGPTPEKRAKSWFNVRFVGEGGGRRVVTEVAGGDPGYDETAKMLAEAALCLVHDDLPETSGQVTTAAAMGDRLIDRLQKAGITFRVLRQD